MRYLEDFAVGQKYESGRVTVTADQIRTYAAEFDPQPFHLDDAQARDSLFGGLAASGWHTASLTMDTSSARCSRRANPVPGPRTA